MPRCTFSWNARRMILIFTRKGTRPEVISAAARKGHLGGRGTAPENPKGADPLRNNRVDVHGSPTVNEDHFKRSRPQCVYLANVKFTCGKRGTRNEAHTAAPRRSGFVSSETQIRSFCVAVRHFAAAGSCNPVVSSWLSFDELKSNTGVIRLLSVGL